MSPHRLARNSTRSCVRFPADDSSLQPQPLENIMTTLFARAWVPLLLASAPALYAQVPQLIN